MADPARTAMTVGPADVGHRVSLRRVLDPEAPPGSGGRFTDVVGELRAFGPAEVVVDTRHGRVRLPVAALVAGRRVPPAPPRR